MTTNNNFNSDIISNSNVTTVSMVGSPSTQNLTTTTRVYEHIAPVTLLFFFGVVGNAIALFVLCYSAKDHKWRPFYRLVCGLAISDGGGILASYPFAEYRYISNFEYTFPKPLCDYLGFVFMFTLMSSAMIVCCMSFDRFFAIFFPFLYNTPTKERRALVMLACAWTLSGIISSLHLYGLGASKNYYPGSWCFLHFIDMSSKAKVIYSYIYAATGAVVLILTMLINVLVIVFFLKNKFSKTVNKTNRNELSVVLFLLMIVTVFTSCWAPLVVNIFQHATFSIVGQGRTELIVLRMGVTNSVIDPWIYILFRKEACGMVMNCFNKILNRKKESHNKSDVPKVASKITIL